MDTVKGKRIAAILSSIFLLLCMTSAFSWVKGIYVTQYTFQNTKYLNYLIKRSKQVGINSFVIDFNYPSKYFRKNLPLLKKSGIKFVARIVMFPHGALNSQVESKTFLAKRFKRIKQVIALHPDAIQLDYIRFRPSQRKSTKNSQRIYAVIQQVKQLLKGTNIELQADVFGEAAHRASHAIGQDVALFANSVDVICPMVYPSHYEPFRYHAKHPYKTVYGSLVALRQQIKKHPDVRIYAYLEIYNYRYPMSRSTKVKYILDELRAVRDSHADGWYVWSAQNKYSILFSILDSYGKRY